MTIPAFIMDLTVQDNLTVGQLVKDCQPVVVPVDMESFRIIWTRRLEDATQSGNQHLRDKARAVLELVQSHEKLNHFIWAEHNLGIVAGIHDAVIVSLKHVGPKNSSGAKNG